MDSITRVTEAAETHLTHGTVELIRGFHLNPSDPGGGHPLKFTVMLEGGQTCLAKAAAPGDLNQLQQTKNEVAAWQLLKRLGWSELGAMTVLRKLESPAHGELSAALQVAWPSEMLVHAPELALLPERQTVQAAVFDFLVLNTDRGTHNWAGVSDGIGGLRLKLYDHGHCFGLHGSQPSSVFLAHRSGYELSPDAICALESVTDEALGDLRDLLEQATLEGISRRRDLLLRAGAVRAELLAA